MAKKYYPIVMVTLALALGACGGPAGTAPAAETAADVAATVEAQVQATVIAEQVAATVAAQQAQSPIAAPTTAIATTPPTAATSAAAATAAAASNTATPASDVANEPTIATTANGGQRVELFGGQVSFVLPPDFRELDDAEKLLKYPRGNAPAHAYANDRLSVSIAVSRPSAQLSPEQLGEFRQAMEQTIERSIPAVNWLARDSVTINGRAWEHLQFTSAAIDTDIHNDVYMTEFDGAPLLFNFNTTVGQYEEARLALEQSRDSITIAD